MFRWVLSITHLCKLSIADITWVSIEFWSKFTRLHTLAQVCKKGNGMSKKSKDKISAALIHLMEDDPFDVITVSEICSNASLVRKTFYNNFSSKEDVIVYIVEKLVAEYEGMIREESSFSPREMAYMYFCYGAQHKKTLSLLIDNNLFYLFRNQFNSILSSINALVPRNKLIALDDDDLAYVLAFHSAGVTHILEMWIRTGFKKSAREMSDIFYTIAQGMQAEE